VPFHVSPRVAQSEDAVGGLVGLGAQRTEQCPVDAVAGHQFRGLGGQRLGLRSGAALVLGLGEQLAHPVEQVAVVPRKSTVLRQVVLPSPPRRGAGAVHVLELGKAKSPDASGFAAVTFLYESDEVKSGVGRSDPRQR
jgi:hypothetical protein